MITFQELVSSPIEPEHQKNIQLLLEKINKFEAAYGKPLRATSGYRSLKKHLAIYAAKGITDQSKIPMKSRHLSGEAVDFSDPNGLLQNWILANEELVKTFGLYFEDFAYTKTWVHAQSIQPKSGKMFFIP